MAYTHYQNTPGQGMSFDLVSSNDHESPMVGLGNVTSVQLRKEGGAWFDATGGIEEVGLGTYDYMPVEYDLDTQGAVLLRPTAPGCDTEVWEFAVVAVTAAQSGDDGVSSPGHS